MPTDPKRRTVVKAIGAAAIVSQVGLSKPARAQVKLRYSNASNAGYLANIVMQEFWDEVRKRTTELIEKKVQGQDIVAAPTEAPQAKVIDLMEALKASLAGKGAPAAPKAKPAEAPPAAQERRPAKKAASEKSGNRKSKSG